MTDHPIQDQEGLPWITVHGDNPQIPNDFACALAGIVVDWSRFENGIAIDTAQFMKIPEVRDSARDAPLNFKKKVELWKHCIQTLYHHVRRYRELAAELCSKGKIVANHRHRLMHGHWVQVDNGQEVEFEIVNMRGLDKVDYLDAFTVNLQYLTALHADIRQLTDRLYEFQLNRIMHSQLGSVQPHHHPKNLEKDN